MDYVRQLSARYRIPDLSKLWRVPDVEETERRVVDRRTVFEKIEPYLINLQELALWTDPRSSASAILCFHLAYFFVGFFCSRFIFVAAWVGAIGFVYVTWTHRIWPEIRVEVPESERPDSEDFTPVHPECLSAPEIEQRWQQLRTKIAGFARRLGDMRSETPGKFCLFSCAFCLLLAYVGSFTSTLGLVYFFGVGVLTLPGMVRLLTKYPAVNCFMETVLSSRHTDALDGKAEDNNPPKKTELVKSLSEDSSSNAAYLSSLQSKFVDTITQGSAYVSENLPSFGLRADKMPEPASLDISDDMLEYLPHDTKEVRDVLERAVMKAERTTEMQACTGSPEIRIDDDDDSMLQSLESGHFLAGMDPMPDPEQLDELDQHCPELLPGSRHFVPLEEEDFLPSVARLPSMDNDSEDEPDATEVRASPPRNIKPPTLAIVKPSSESSITRDVTDEVQDQSVILLQSAMTEGESGPPSSDSSSSAEDEFEMITESELKAVDGFKEF